MEVGWKDMLEARDRRGARDAKTQLGVPHRRAHDSHARRRYCGETSSTTSRLRQCRAVTPEPVVQSDQGVISE
jgi:hypothetical protein